MSDIKNMVAMLTGADIGYEETVNKENCHSLYLEAHAGFRSVFRFDKYGKLANIEISE